MNLPENVTVVEVGPRDGLQSQGVNVPLPDKVDFINLLNLRTVVNLSQEVPVRAVLSFFQENNITLENLGLQVC